MIRKDQEKKVRNIEKLISEIQSELELIRPSGIPDPFEPPPRTDKWNKLVESTTKLKNDLLNFAYTSDPDEEQSKQA